MSEETEEFNERFETIEQALKYIADSQAKSEWTRAKAESENRASLSESRARLDEIEKHLAYIAKVLRINVEEYEFQEDKLQKAGEILSKRRS